MLITMASIHHWYLIISGLFLLYVLLRLIGEDIVRYLKTHYPKKYGYYQHNKFGYNYKSGLTLLILLLCLPYFNFITLFYGITYFFKVTLKKKE